MSYANSRYLEGHIVKYHGHEHPQPRHYRWPNRRPRKPRPPEIWRPNIFDDDPPTEHSSDESDESKEETEDEEVEEDDIDDDDDDQNQPDDENTTTYHPTAGRVHGDVENYEHWHGLKQDPWRPFITPEEFLQARRFVESHTSKNHMRRHFKEGGCRNPEQFSYTSGKTLYKKLSEMEERLPRWQEKISETPHGKRTFHFRDILECAKYLLKQRCYMQYTVYAPFQETTPQGLRVYSEMNSADWWWDIQDRIPAGTPSSLSSAALT
ncbi:hypothetical protein BDD12DRAFT_877663 [Trichophaea hybrida]|nr:hypothetical protein BDD12DRAFT_877663 [Trichophaea hybrida]